MSELVEFIRGCLDADEQTARAAVEESATEWQYANHLGSWRVQTVRELGNPGYEYHVPITFDQEGLSDSVQPGAGAHIARHDPARVLADCGALRAVIKWHENWPVLVETPPTIEAVDSTDPQSFAFRASQQIAWMTQREYVRRFGAEPPTSPILLALAQPFAGRPGWRDEWGINGHKEAQG